jgi:hypothetical protein
MKKLFVRFFNWLFSWFPGWIFIILVLSGLVLLFAKLFGAADPVLVGFLTLMGLGAAAILFVWLRQFWWWITSTGDYKKKN